MAWVSERRPDWSRGDLLPVVVTDASRGDLLMLAWANRAAIEATERTGEAHFWSRSRDELWRKGATSGNVMRVVEMAVDCDADAIVYRVESEDEAVEVANDTPYGLGSYVFTTDADQIVAIDLIGDADGLDLVIATDT